VTDLERQLRDSLRGDALLSGEPSPVRIPAHVRRRIRVRRTAGMAAALVLTAGLWAGIANLAPLTPPTRVVPGQPSSGDDPVLLGSGSTDGYPWTLSIRRDASEWCLELEDQFGRVDHCWAFVGPVPDLDVVLEVAAFPFRYGPIASEADKVVYSPQEGGRQSGRIFDTPPELNLQFDVFMLALTEPARGAVLALDASGEVMAEQAIPRPGEDTIGASGFSAQAVVLDAFENVIAVGPAPRGVAKACLFDLRPGVSADVQEIRCLLGSEISRIAPEIEEWWLARPQEDSEEQVVDSWWRDYPIDRAHPRMQDDRASIERLDRAG
jgi:hypothetical protein